MSQEWNQYFLLQTLKNSHCITAEVVVDIYIQGLCVCNCPFHSHLINYMCCILDNVVTSLLTAGNNITVMHYFLQKYNIHYIIKYNST